MSDKRIQVMWNAVEDVDDDAVYDGRSFQAGAASRDAEVAELREKLEAFERRSTQWATDLAHTSHLRDEYAARISRVEAVCAAEELEIGEHAATAVVFTSEVREALAVPSPAEETPEPEPDPVRPDDLCPSCGSDPDDPDLHKPDCERNGTCAQLGPPWIDKPWHPEPNRWSMKAHDDHMSEFHTVPVLPEGEPE